MEGSFSFLLPQNRDLLLEIGVTVRYAKKDLIVEEGDSRQAIFLINEGRVRIERNQMGNQIRVATLGPNEVFGEMAFVQRKLASATVIADTAVKAVVIEAPDVYAVLSSVPGFATRFYLCLARTLAERLDETTAALIHSGR